MDKQEQIAILEDAIAQLKAMRETVLSMISDNADNTANAETVTE